MSTAKLRSGLASVAAFYCLLAVVPLAQAQGCSMCRETASFQKARAVDALQSGIVLLGLPPLAIIGGIAWMTYRRWESSDDAE
jgi:hypothetical protein